MSTAPYDRSEYTTPGRGLGILDVFRRRYLLKLLVQKGTSLRYRNSVLGWLWSYVRPTVQFFVYFFVVGHVLGASGKVGLYPLYLFSGIVVVNLFNEAFGNATKSIVANKSLVRKIYLPRELFPIAAIIGSFINFLPQLLVLVIVAVIFGWIPTWASLGLMLASLAIIVLFSTGIGLITSAINVRFRDAQNFVEIVRMVATWTAPVLYTWVMIYGKIPDWMFFTWASNPLAVCVEMFHQAVWGPTIERLVDAKVAAGQVLSEGEAKGNIGFAPDYGIYVLVAVCLTVLALIIGQWVFRRFERTFAQDL